MYPKLITLEFLGKHLAFLFADAAARQPTKHISAQPTEIELVLKLKECGIDLKQYACVSSTGSDFHSILVWKLLQ